MESAAVPSQKTSQEERRSGQPWRQRTGARPERNRGAVSSRRRRDRHCALPGEGLPAPWRARPRIGARGVRMRLRTPRRRAHGARGQGSWVALFPALPKKSWSDNRVCAGSRVREAPPTVEIDRRASPAIGVRAGDGSGDGGRTADISAAHPPGFRGRVRTGAGLRWPRLGLAMRGAPARLTNISRDRWNGSWRKDAAQLP